MAIDNDTRERENRIQDDWTPEKLLAQKGIFPIEPVARILEITTARLKAEADRLRREGVDVYKVLGVRRQDSEWVVHMPVFAVYYQSHLKERVRYLESGWDGNELLRRRGIFFLRDVCTLLPFTPNQLRYQAQKTRNSRARIGIWKDEELSAYLVDMPVFSKWITDLWCEEVKNF
jgi:hypothetical protein